MDAAEEAQASLNNAQPAASPDDYDSPWKEAIEQHFSDFLQFFFPEAHAQIDWREAPVFLDQELRAVVRDAELGKRVVDKLLDWASSEARLTDSSNPFAAVTLAHLATRATRTDMAARKVAKSHLLQHLYRQGWERQQIINLIRVIDWMMRLPKALDLQLRQDLASMKEETNMRYLTSFERLAREEGIQLGRVRMLMRLLNRRFGDLPAWAETKLTEGTDSDIDAWHDAALSAGTLEAVFASSAESH